LPEAAVIWTLATGYKATTYPGIKHLFPQLCEPTATLWTGDPPVIEPIAERNKPPPFQLRRAATADGLL